MVDLNSNEISNGFEIVGFRFQLIKNETMNKMNYEFLYFLR
jgi:hypothetical protein